VAAERNGGAGISLAKIAKIAKEEGEKLEFQNSFPTLAILAILARDSSGSLR
jgi:hypothetical protein